MSVYYIILLENNFAIYTKIAIFQYILCMIFDLEILSPGIYPDYLIITQIHKDISTGITMGCYVKTKLNII